MRQPSVSEGTGEIPPLVNFGSVASSERLFTLSVDLKPSMKTHLRESLISFALAPMSLLVLLLSTTSILGWSAVGQPLSSPEAWIGLVLAAILLMRVGLSATRTSAGMIVMAAWSAVIVALYWVGLSKALAVISQQGLDARVASSLLVQLTLPTAWAMVPVLLFATVLGALLATRVARRRRQLLTKKGIAAFAADKHLSRAAFVASLLAIVIIWLAILELAPADVSQVAVFGSLALGLNGAAMGGVLLAAGGLFVLAASAGWAPFNTVSLTGLLLVLPAVLIFPVSSSLSGSVATPGSPVATAVALSSPVVGAVGILLMCLTWSLHWVQTSTEQEIVETG